MLNGLRDFTVKMVAGANVATVAFMLLVGYSDLLNPATFSRILQCRTTFSGLSFPQSWLSDILGRLPCQVCSHSFVGLPGQLRTCPPVYAGQYEGRCSEGKHQGLSYNTWGFGNQTEDEDGVNICLSYLLEQNADIVCLQEAQPTGRNAEQIDSMLKPIYAYQDVTVHPHGGNALMLLSKYPILSKELIPYESQGNMSVAYRLKINDEPVLLINNHLETTGLSKEDRQQFKKLVVGKLQVDTAEQTSKLLVVKLAEATKKRAPQAEAVARYIREHRGMSTILCGDFNDGPISYVHRTIAKNLVDCYVESGNGPGISYHRGGFFVRIDNIMCSEDWEPYECKVDDKIAVSDHYPIICKLKKRPKKQK